MDGDMASAQAVQAAQQQARERRRSSISLAIPICANQMAASVEIGHDQVEFEAHGVKISQDGLFIDGNNVSSVHQNDLRVLRELGRGACSVVKQAQVRTGTQISYRLLVGSLQRGTQQSLRRRDVPLVCVTRKVEKVLLLAAAVLLCAPYNEGRKVRTANRVLVMKKLKLKITNDER